MLSIAHLMAVTKRRYAQNSIEYKGIFRKWISKDSASRKSIAINNKTYTRRRYTLSTEEIQKYSAITVYDTF